MQHDYLTLGGRVARETITTDGTVTAVLDFIYDSQGRPFALNYSENGSSFTTYYYVLNLQGDVVKLVQILSSSTGIQEYSEVANYTYDAWGNIISSSGTMADLNPLRYRGYYYDSETGFYYLQSRYYDPANHRFINADALASTGQGFVGTNMFAYCNNASVGFYDPTGHALSPVTVAICDGGCGKKSEYDREKAISYARTWYDDRNGNYYSYSTDCANFVSQCLNAGGIEQSKEWHSSRTEKTYWYNPAAWFSNNYRYDWDVGEAWWLADAQYQYFSSFAQNKTVEIASVNDIQAVVSSNNIQAGDLLYFVNTSGNIHHATIITKVDSGMIYYAGHTRSCYDRPLSEGIGDESVMIIIIG